MAVTIAIREARESDMSSFASVVNFFIENTTVNFRTHPQSAGEWRDDWKLLAERYPWLVAQEGTEVVGLAYAGPWKARNAYDWSAESTVYVANGRHRRGIGRLLYDQLLAILDAQGYRSTIGVIALPNLSSVALHEACGFRHAGTLQSVGFKHGHWHDVGFWQRLSAKGAEGAEMAAGAILPVAAVWPQAERRSDATLIPGASE